MTFSNGSRPSLRNCLRRNRCGRRIGLESNRSTRNGRGPGSSYGRGQAADEESDRPLSGERNVDRVVTAPCVRPQLVERPWAVTAALRLVGCPSIPVKPRGQAVALAQRADDPHREEEQRG